MSPKKYLEIIKLIIGNGLLTLTLIILLEFGLRLFWPDRFSYKRTYPGQYKNKELLLDTTQVNVTWPLQERDLGWVCNKNKNIMFTNKKYKDLNIEYVINNQGFRDHKEYDTTSIQITQTKVMLLGDSFIFGVYLAEQTNISSKLERKLGTKYVVYNMGIPGWGIDQMYLAYLKYSPIIMPQTVVLMFIEDDIPRVLESYRRVEGMNKPSFLLDNDKLRLRSLEQDSPGFITHLFENIKILNPFYKRFLIYKNNEIIEKIFSDLITTTNKNNQRLVVIRCPRVENILQMQKLDDYEFINSLKDNQGLYYELFDDMRKLPTDKMRDLYIQDDGHLSSNGSDYVADKISHIVLGQGVN